VWVPAQIIDKPDTRGKREPYEFRADMDTSSKVMAKGSDKDYARKRKSEILSTQQTLNKTMMLPITHV
jgi:hypothetical protein